MLLSSFWTLSISLVAGYAIAEPELEEYCKIKDPLVRQEKLEQAFVLYASETADTIVDGKVITALLAAVSDDTNSDLKSLNLNDYVVQIEDFDDRLIVLFRPKPRCVILSDEKANRFDPPMKYLIAFDGAGSIEYSFSKPDYRLLSKRVVPQ